jgi:hypothetical protein
MFSEYATVTNFQMLPSPDRRKPARDAEIRFRIKRALNRKAA